MSLAEILAWFAFVGFVIALAMLGTSVYLQRAGYLPAQVHDMRSLGWILLVVSLVTAAIALLWGMKALAGMFNR